MLFCFCSFQIFHLSYIDNKIIFLIMNNSCTSSLRFPQKLWKIINECNTGAIKWYDDKSILLDYEKFQDEYLDVKDSVFKTKNVTSFVRQLNLYGFRKNTTHNRELSYNLDNPNVHEFVHDYFRKNRVDLLCKVSRRHDINKTKQCVGSHQDSRLRKCHVSFNY